MGLQPVLKPLNSGLKTNTPSATLGANGAVPILDPNMVAMLATPTPKQVETADKIVEIANVLFDQAKELFITDLEATLKVIGDEPVAQEIEHLSVVQGAVTALTEFPSQFAAVDNDLKAGIDLTNTTDVGRLETDLGKLGGTAVSLGSGIVLAAAVAADAPGIATASATIAGISGAVETVSSLFGVPFNPAPKAPSSSTTTTSLSPHGLQLTVHPLTVHPSGIAPPSAVSNALKTSSPSMTFMQPASTLSPATASSATTSTEPGTPIAPTPASMGFIPVSTPNTMASFQDVPKGLITTPLIVPKGFVNIPLHS